MYVSDIVAAFYSGPNLKKVDFTVKCVNETLPCDAPAEGTPANGTLPKVWAMVNATVSDLNPNTTYWCYILTFAKKVAKCQGPFPATTLPAVVV